MQKSFSEIEQSYSILFIDMNKKRLSVSHWIVPNINTMGKFLEFLRQKKHKVTLFYFIY